MQLLLVKYQVQTQEKSMPFVTVIEIVTFRVFVVTGGGVREGPFLLNQSKVNGNTFYN